MKSPFAVAIDDAEPLPAFTGEELDRFRDIIGWPIRPISDGLVDVARLDSTYGDNHASRANARAMTEQVLVEIARLHGTDLRSLLLAYDLHRAVDHLFERTGPILREFLPLIAKDVVAGEDVAGRVMNVAGPAPHPAGDLSPGPLGKGNGQEQEAKTP